MKSRTRLVGKLEEETQNNLYRQDTLKNQMFKFNKTSQNRQQIVENMTILKPNQARNFTSYHERTSRPNDNQNYNRNQVPFRHTNNVQEQGRIRALQQFKGGNPKSNSQYQNFHNHVGQNRNQGNSRLSNQGPVSD